MTALISVLVFSAPAGPSEAAEPWRLIGSGAAEATSSCIGKPQTPLCAVETLLACFQRSRPDLCQQVDDGSDQYAQIFDAPADPGKYLLYRQVSSETDKPAPGKVTLVIEQREIPRSQPIDEQTGTQSRFTLVRRADGGWRIESWDDPND